MACEIGTFGDDRDYRVADLAVLPKAARVRRGVDGPPLALFEVLSPGDESYEKIPWYLGRGAGAVVIVHPDILAVEVFIAHGTAPPDDDGLVAVPGLGVRLGAAPDGSALLIETGDGVHRIEL